MTPKEALHDLGHRLASSDSSKLVEEVHYDVFPIIEQAIAELERLKKFKATFDNYELAKKQDFIAYENWLECEKELEELKRDVKRYFDLGHIEFPSAEKFKEYLKLQDKLLEVGKEE